jgi:hypothetical protein
MEDVAVMYDDRTDQERLADNEAIDAEFDERERRQLEREDKDYDNVQLGRCPFCASLLTRIDGKPLKCGWLYRVYCIECEANGGWNVNEQDAADEWNFIAEYMETQR